MYLYCGCVFIFIFFICKFNDGFGTLYCTVLLFALQSFHHACYCIDPYKDDSRYFGDVPLCEVNHIKNMKYLLHVNREFRRLRLWPFVLVITCNRHVDAFRANAALFVAWSTPRSFVPRTSPNPRCSWVEHCGIHDKFTPCRYRGRGTHHNREHKLGSGGLWTLYSWTSDDGGTDDTDSQRAKQVTPEESEASLGPSPSHSPRRVTTLALEALRANDEPYLNHGCEVAIRLSSSSNPASHFTPGSMRTYLDDPSMPFYRILGDWDEMDAGGHLEMYDEHSKAYQEVRVRRKGDPEWSTVNFDLVRENGCWLIERLWVNDKSTARQGWRDGGQSGTQGRQGGNRPLTLAELFDEDRLEMMSCKYSDYDPDRLNGEWLEEYPNASLSPKAVALTCILALRYNNDGTGLEIGDPEKEGIAEDEDDDAPDGKPSAHFGNERRRRRKRRLNEGCERVIRFCSPTNVASTLTPAHFAKYLSDPWYEILKTWDELAFHSEEVSEDGKMANLVACDHYTTKERCINDLLIFKTGG